AVLRVNGRSTSFLHDGELIYDLYAHGLSVYEYDHRGQGLSGRLAPEHRQSEVGHTDAFASYVADLDAFVERVVKPAEHRELLVVATSLGGGIAASALTDPEHPLACDGAVLTVPMLGLQLGGLPEWFVYLKTRWGPTTSFAALDGRGFVRHPFEGNDVSSDP